MVFDSAESKPPGGSGTGGFVIRDKLKTGDLGRLIQLYGLIIHQQFGSAKPFEYEFAKILTNFALEKITSRKNLGIGARVANPRFDPCGLVN